MKKKPNKVEEPTVPYADKSVNPITSAAPKLRYASATDVREANAKLMQVHRKVLQKLAQ